MSSSRHEHDDRYQRSRSRSHRYRDDYYDDDDYKEPSRSRSRSRSTERYRRRHQRRSRSRSRSNDYYKSRRSHTGRHRDSRSRSRSRTSSRKQRSHSRSSHRSYKTTRHHSHHSRSRTPKHTDSHSQRHESRNTRSHSRSPSTDRHHQSHAAAENLNEIETYKFPDQENSSTQYFSSNTDPDLENLPLPEQQTETNKSTINSNYEYYEEPQEPIDKERIHREIEEKLREALAKEGKIYPPPKPEASHPVFANDGSFLEIFKKMQEAQTSIASTSAATSTAAAAAAVITMPTIASTAAATPSFITKPKGPAPPVPLVGRRRGGKILKTGVVAKPKAVAGGNDDKDFWSLYLAEVNKYKNNACELDPGNRPLLK